jgi:hypothetical protein
MKNEQTSDLKLERYALGELSREEEEALQKSLESDEVLRARLAALERSNREILDEYPPERMAGSIRARARVSPSRAIVWSISAAAVLVVSLSFFALRSNYFPEISGSSGDIVRAKGEASPLILFRKTKLGAEELSDGAGARKGDILQVGYGTGRPGYGAIFSIDGRGSVTFHLPLSYSGSLQAAPRLDTSGRVLLPSAYELDDAPSYERFIFVYSSAPFDLRLVWRAAQELSANPNDADRRGLKLQAAMRWYSFLVRKEGVVK